MSQLSWFGPMCEKVQRADELSRKHLQMLKRSDGTDAYQHGVRVAQLMFNRFGETGSDEICAAILHDVIEQSDVTLHELERDFGSKVARYVGSLTRHGDESEADPLKKMHKKIAENIGLAAQSRETRLIKLADLIDNLSSIDSIVSTDFRYPKIPRWVLESKLSLLPISKATDEKAARNLKGLISGLEKRFSSEIDSLFYNYNSHYKM